MSKVKRWLFVENGIRKNFTPPIPECRWMYLPPPRPDEKDNTIIVVDQDSYVRVKDKANDYGSILLGIQQKLKSNKTMTYEEFLINIQQCNVKESELGEYIE